LPPLDTESSVASVFLVVDDGFPAVALGEDAESLVVPVELLGNPPLDVLVASSRRDDAGVPVLVFFLDST
jgi:hypothetical protein